MRHFGGVSAIELVRVFRRKKSRSKRKPKVKEKPALPEAPIGKATIQGEVKYVWGAVGRATIMAGDKSTVADSTGKYEMPGVDAGMCIVSAQAPFPGYGAAPQSITLAAGETKVVDFFLDFKKTVVEGYVYDADGKPIAGGTVSGVLCGKDMETTTIDDQGHFRFDRARPGNQFIRVNALGYMGETRVFTAKENETATLEFRLQPAAYKVHGTVTDKGGKPLRAEVHLSKANIIVQKTLSNSENGHYEFSVLPDTYDVLANASGYQSKGWRGQIAADTKVDLSLAILPQVKMERRP